MPRGHTCSVYRECQLLALAFLWALCSHNLCLRNQVLLERWAWLTVSGFSLCNTGHFSCLGHRHNTVSLESSQQFFFVVLLPSLLAKEGREVHGVEVSCFGSWDEAGAFCSHVRCFFLCAMVALRKALQTCRLTGRMSWSGSMNTQVLALEVSSVVASRRFLFSDTLVGVKPVFESNSALQSLIKYFFSLTSLSKLMWPIVKNGHMFSPLLALMPLKGCSLFLHPLCLITWLISANGTAVNVTQAEGWKVLVYSPGFLGSLLLPLSVQELLLACWLRAPPQWITGLT